MKALIIIDMQNGGFPEGLFRYDAEAVIDNINKLAAAMRASGNKVIFIQHDGSKDDVFIPGSYEWEIIPGLEKQDGDIFISKTANDVFYRSALKSTLDELGVKEVIITGWATDYCVDSTVRSALAHDYDITVVSDAHTCGNRPHLSAAHIIAHHNYTWQNMLPTNGSISVVPFEQVVRSYLMSGVSA